MWRTDGDMVGGVGGCLVDPNVAAGTEGGVPEGMTTVGSVDGSGVSGTDGCGAGLASNEFLFCLLLVRYLCPGAQINDLFFFGGHCSFLTTPLSRFTTIEGLF